MTKEEKETYYIYLAGIFDGEGCVRIGKDKHRAKTRPFPAYYLSAQISMQNRYPLEIMAKLFGHEKSIKYSRTMWRVIFKCQRAYDFLEAIYPYLTIKKDQVRLGMNFHRLKLKQHPRLSLPQEEIDFREAFFQHMHFLKSEQKHPTPDPRPQHDYSWVKVPKEHLCTL